MINTEIRYKNQLCARIGLTITLWLKPNVMQLETWPAVLRAAQAFAKSSENQLNWYSCSVDQQATWLSTMGMQSGDAKLALESADLLDETLHQIADQPLNFDSYHIEAESSELLDIALGAEWLDGQPWQEPQSLLLYANLPPAGSDVSGFIRVHLPIDEESSQTTVENAQTLENFMRACLQSLPILHGTAGFGLQLPLSFRFFHANLFHAISLHETIEKYRGLDVYDPAEQAILFSEKIYTVNWLSFISNAFTDGQVLSLPTTEPALIHQLVSIESIGSGWLLKSGALPKLLMNEERKPLEEQALRAVAKLLKPWRAESVPNECIAPSPYGYADPQKWKDSYTTYLQRFD